MSAATTTYYELCPDCTDGSCGSCGPKSNEHAAPGVRLVVRQVRFVPCACKGPPRVDDGRPPCTNCGPTVHELATPGVTIEVVDEHGARRWVPSIHFDKNGKSACGSGWVGTQLTSNWKKVTCKRCLKWGS